MPIIDRSQLRPLPAIQKRKQNVPLEQIIAIQGQSPLAQGIGMTGDVIAQALQRKNELRQRAQQMQAIGQITGQPVPQGVPEMTPDLQLKALQIRTEMDKARAAKEAEPQKLAAIRLLEKNAGVPEGAFGDDLPTARFMAGQMGIDKRASAQDVDRDRNFDLREGRTFLDWKYKLRTDPLVRSLYKEDLGLSQIDSIVGMAKGGNTTAAAALGTKVARGLGDVGALSDGDITRYVQSGQLSRKAGDVLSKWLYGKPTDWTLDEIAQIAQVLRAQFELKIQPIYNEYVEAAASNIKGTTPDEAARRLAVTYKPLRSAGQAPGGLQTIPRQLSPAAQALIKTHGGGGGK